MAAKQTVKVPDTPETEDDQPLLSTGAWHSLPIYVLMLIGFAAPLIAVAGYSFATPRSFDLFSSFTLANYAGIFDPGSTQWHSFAWSFGYAFATTGISLLICYPIAIGLVRIFGKWAAIISILFIFPLFISENVRLYGWVLFFFKQGFLDGLLHYIGMSVPDVLFKPGIILFGMIYTYIPYMLFPVVLGISLVPKDVIYAARDLGASRWQTWKEVELPLATPGILIGVLLTFVLSAGAISEAKIMGGQAVIVIPHDIEIAFTYAQNWPLGSALAMVLTVIIGGITLTALTKLDLDRILGRK